MSAMSIKIICSSILSIMGLIVVKFISGSKEKILSFKSIVLMSFLIIVPAIFHNNEYSFIFSIILFIITIVTYKEILCVSMINSTISCGIFHLFLIILEFIGSIILSPFLTIEIIRSAPYINILINIVFSTISFIIFSKTELSKILPKFINRTENTNRNRIITFFTLVIIAMSIILYSISQNYKVSAIFTNNFLIFIVLFLLVIILFSERKDYQNLSDEYESLFNYVQIFEDWIEKEQLTRHEYKNQLAVLRNLTKEKKVKDKIDSIVDDFINIDNETITQLKNIPSGGLKGLLYYKISIAKKNKINLTVDIDDKAGKELSKINEEHQKILTKLLGIYLDNAIEAAVETSKKLSTIEIYKSKCEIKIVISNSFNSKNSISNRNKKGMTTKGSGRGNGLYFASKLISNNKWIDEKQEIIDNFYIQSLIINKKV